MDFQTRLFDLRENANLKQTDLAEKINLRSSAISKYEKGLTQPSMDTLIKFTEIFNVSMDYLMGISNVKNPYSPESFTPKEACLIMEFRKLTKENQIRIDERISANLDGQKNELL